MLYDIKSVIDSIRYMNLFNSGDHLFGSDTTFANPVPSCGSSKTTSVNSSLSRSSSENRDATAPQNPEENLSLELETLHEETPPLEYRKSSGDSAAIECFYN